MNSKKSPAKQKNPADGLKQAFEKLSNEVKNLGMVLGVQEESSTSSIKSGTESKKPKNEAKPVVDKNEFVKDMTQEEKKAQRALKAAQKKEKAEAAAAKKLSAGQNPQSQKQVKKSNEKTEKLNAETSLKKEEKSPEVEKLSNGIKQLNIKNNSVKTEKKEVKSVLKAPNNQNKGHTNGQSREVQFDLQANTTNIVNLSDSEDALLSSVPEPPIVSLEDASSISHVFPSFLTLFARCDKELISDLDQLCEEFIKAFREFLSDWKTKRIQENGDPTTFGFDLEQAIRPQLAYLTQNGRWPLPYALGNIVRQLKREILQMKGETTNLNNSQQDLNLTQFELLDEWLEYLLKLNFEPAYDAISLHLCAKMKNAKCVLTYDWCPVVNHVLHSSMEKYPDLRVCFVDSELNGKGVRHVNSFIEKGYRCQYTDLKSIGFAVQQSSMVILGCSAILSNGCVATTKGAIQIALTAKAFNVPVLVLSQCFKFVDKVQSYTRMALLGRENVELLPSTLVTAVVTDIRILPPTAAPAVLKAKALGLD